MKKTLMAGTALVASSLLLAAGAGTAVAQDKMKKAEKIRLGLGGYMEQWFGYATEDKTFEAGQGANDLDQKSDSEIYIKGDTTLDNGIKVGAKWEIEGDGDATSSAAGSATDNTGRFDEAMLYISGSFGRINLGQEDTASELMGYGAPTVGPVGTNKSDAGDWVRDPKGTVNFSHNMDLGLSDKHGVSYYSPRVAGLQFGASYHPVVNENSDATQPETSKDHQGMSTAVNYVTKFGGTSVAVYGGFAMKETADDVTSPGHFGSSYEGDATGWGAGANVGFGGFTVGASYISEDDDTTKNTFSVGVRYKAGMNAFSVGYQYADSSVINSTEDDEGKLITVGYERTLGPGVTLGASIAKVDWDGSGTGASQDNDGIMIVTGIKLDF
jgi:hypothetical protein